MPVVRLARGHNKWKKAAKTTQQKQQQLAHFRISLYLRDGIGIFSYWSLLLLQDKNGSPAICRAVQKIFWKQYLFGSFDAFDIIRDKGVSYSPALDIIYSQLFSSKSYKNDTLDEEVCALAACILSNNYRGPSIERQRLNWDAHVKALLREGQFRQFYRMSYNFFVCFFGTYLTNWWRTGSKAIMISTIITVSHDRRGAENNCYRISSKKFFRNDGWLHRCIGWMAMQN